MMIVYRNTVNDTFSNEIEVYKKHQDKRIKRLKDKRKHTDI